MKNQPSVDISGLRLLAASWYVKKMILIIDLCAAHKYSIKIKP
jgi:hypothetical protein